MHPTNNPLFRLGLAKHAQLEGSMVLPFQTLPPNIITPRDGRYLVSVAWEMSTSVGTFELGPSNVTQCHSTYLNINVGNWENALWMPWPTCLRLRWQLVGSLATRVCRWVPSQVPPTAGGSSRMGVGSFNKVLGEAQRGEAQQSHLLADFR